MASETRMLNLAKVQARLARLPDTMKAAVAAQLAIEADELVAAMQRAAPVDETSDNPGNFRDSIHHYPNPDRDLSVRILADARDAKGKFIGGNIEHGHRAADGSHVAAKPSFFPTYRARKKAMKRRISTAGRKAVQQLYPKV